MKNETRESALLRLEEDLSTSGYKLTDDDRRILRNRYPVAMLDLIGTIASHVWSDGFRRGQDQPCKCVGAAEQ